MTSAGLVARADGLDLAVGTGTAAATEERCALRPGRES
jgi:hypothetical protein